MADRALAGDGILAGLSLAQLVRASGKPLRALVAEFAEYPQKLTNIRVHDKRAWREDAWFTTEYRRLRSRYHGIRFYIRPSGTENVVRVLTEAEDASRCAEANAEVCRLFAVWDNR
jgi:phosphoglucosamine mutase